MKRLVLLAMLVATSAGAQERWHEPISIHPIFGDTIMGGMVVVTRGGTPPACQDLGWASGRAFMRYREWLGEHFPNGTTVEVDLLDPFIPYPPALLRAADRRYRLWAGVRNRWMWCVIQEASE